MSRDWLIGFGGAAILASVMTVGCTAGHRSEEPAPDRSARGDYAQYVVEHRRWEEVFVGCLREAGLDPVKDRQGGWEGFTAPNRPSEGGLDSACLAEAGPVPINPPFDDSMLEAMYDAEIATAECLRQHGYPVAEPSTKEAFVQGYEVGPPWLALSEVVQTYPPWELESTVLADCPPPDPRDIFAPDR